MNFLRKWIIGRKLRQLVIALSLLSSACAHSVAVKEPPRIVVVRGEEEKTKLSETEIRTLIDFFGEDKDMLLKILLDSKKAVKLKKIVDEFRITSDTAAKIGIEAMVYFNRKICDSKEKAGTFLKQFDNFLSLIHKELEILTELRSFGLIHFVEKNESMITDIGVYNDEDIGHRLRIVEKRLPFLPPETKDKEVYCKLVVGIQNQFKLHQVGHLFPDTLKFVTSARYNCEDY